MTEISQKQLDNYFNYHYHYLYDHHWPSLPAKYILRASLWCKVLLEVWLRAVLLVKLITVDGWSFHIMPSHKTWQSLSNKAD